VLDESLRALKSRLIVVRGQPEQTMDRLIGQLGIKCIYYERDSEPYARQRDAAVERIAEHHGIDICSFTGHTLFDLEDLLRRVGVNLPKRIC
jgi:cryptochrome